MNEDAVSDSSPTASLELGLYLVATPIGNLGDMTERARHILQSVNLVACEDTRTTGKLLQRFAISARLQAFHEHNEVQQAQRLAQLIEEGAAIALVSDAGTPAISDPGFRLVRACRQAGLPVFPIPGPCALIAALSASGLPTDAFYFVGFLPPKKAARQRFFEAHAESPATLVVYESPQRLDKLLEDIRLILGEERVISVAKELTKIHEAFYTGTVREITERLKLASRKGEYVVMIAKNGFSL